MVRILIVEDDRLVLASLADGLEALGYRVVRAESGEDALALFEREAPDLAIIDICLPGISGIDIANTIRESRDTPVIFLSALDTPDVVRTAIALGGMTYLVKPISLQQLVPVIESSLARAADISRLRAQEKNLATALTSSREISVAIGVLMERHDLTAEVAFETIRSHARSSRRLAAEVAQDVIAGSLQLEPPRTRGSS